MINGLSHVFFLFSQMKNLNDLSRIRRFHSTCQKVNLVVTVVDYDRIGTSEPIGKVSFFISHRFKYQDNFNCFCYECEGHFGVQCVWYRVKALVRYVGVPEKTYCSMAYSERPRRGDRRWQEIRGLMSSPVNSLSRFNFLKQWSTLSSSAEKKRGWHIFKINNIRKIFRS